MSDVECKLIYNFFFLLCSSRGTDRHIRACPVATAAAVIKPWSQVWTDWQLMAVKKETGRERERKGKHVLQVLTIYPVLSENMTGKGSWKPKPE